MKDQTVDVVLYSADSAKRRAVIEGIGLRPGKGQPRINWIETATSAGTIMAVEENEPKIVVLDAESPKIGGMAVAQEIRNQLDTQPLFVLLTARPMDQWLATWSGASYTVEAPYDPIVLQEVMVKALDAVR